MSSSSACSVRPSTPARTLGLSADARQAGAVTTGRAPVNGCPSGSCFIWVVCTGRECLQTTPYYRVQEAIPACGNTPRRLHHLGQAGVPNRRPFSGTNRRWHHPTEHGTDGHGRSRMREQWRVRARVGVGKNKNVADRQQLAAPRARGRRGRNNADLRYLTKSAALRSCSGKARVGLALPAPPWFHRGVSNRWRRRWRNLR